MLKIVEMLMLKKNKIFSVKKLKMRIANAFRKPLAESDRSTQNAFVDQTSVGLSVAATSSKVNLGEQEVLGRQHSSRRIGQ